MAVWNSMLLKIITISLGVVKQHVRFIKNESRTVQFAAKNPYYC